MKLGENLARSNRSEELRKEMFLDVEKSYFLKETRERGERWMGEIAKGSVKEQLWAYDENTGTWHHVLADEHSLVDIHNESIEHNLSIPESMMRPLSENTTFYHIHPTLLLDLALNHPKLNRKPYDAEYWAIQFQLPSFGADANTGDVSMAIKMFNNGYKGFKIVTPRGVTSVEWDQKKADEIGDLGSLALDPKDTIAAIESGGFNAGLDDRMKRLNEFGKGALKISYEPFESELH